MRFFKIFVWLVGAIALQAQAQTYPAKPVRVIISFTPASATDIVGRIVGAKLSEYWGQPVVAENRSGAGGSLGSNVVAQAAPDGYMLLINSNAHAVNPAIFAKLPYDTTKDFTDNFGKANPGKINFGHAGVGSGTHLNTVKLITAADIQVTQVPFKGTPEVVAAIFSGAVDCYWVPISADTRRALADPGVREKLANTGNTPMDMSPQEFAKFVRSEVDDYARTARAAGIKPQ